jgi:CRISPR-associated protein Cas2
MKAWSLVCYDVRNDKRLRRVAKVLEGYGKRVQFSVFRCHLGGRELQRLRWELAKIMQEEDSLLVIRLCAHCIQGLKDYAPKGEWAQAEARHVIV